MFCYVAILEGATAYHRMIKEKKNIDKDFFPLSPNGHQLIDQILSQECSLPSEYEEARRVRIPNRNPYIHGLQDDDRKKGKGKLKKESKSSSKKKKAKREKSDSSSSSDEESSPKGNEGVLITISSSTSAPMTDKSKSLNLDKKKRRDVLTPIELDRKKKTKSSQIYSRRPSVASGEM